MGNFNKDINLKLLPFGTKLTYERVYVSKTTTSCLLKAGQLWKSMAG